MKQIFLTITLFTILAILSTDIVAQNNPDADFWTVKSEKGMAIFYRNQPQPFSLLVAGKNPTGKQNNDGSLAIETDSNAVDINFVKTSQFLEKKKINKDAEILKAHRAWHIAIREDAWKEQLNLISDSFTFVAVYNLTDKIFPKRTIPTVYYGYTIGDNPVRSFYQTVLMGDVVLSVGTTFPESVKVDEVRASINKIIESITLLPQQKIAPKNKTTRKRN